jgi:tetratricopeptide (TPR) repeat protein
MLAGAAGLLSFCPGVMGVDQSPSREQPSAENGRQLPLSPAGPGASSTGSAAKTGQLSLEARADIFMARKAYADAVEFYTRALKQSGSTSAILWNKLGIAYQQQLHYRPARKAYNEAIRRRGDLAEPWNNLGTVYYLQDNYRKSLKYYQQAIRLNPTAASFHLNLGTSYYHLKKIKEAVEEYRRALELDPNCLTERSATGTVVQARGADVDFYFYLAKVFASLGRTEEAVRYLRRAFEDGLQDRKRLDQDPDLQKISREPAYVELMKNPPLAIKD